MPTSFIDFIKEDKYFPSIKIAFLTNTTYEKSRQLLSLAAQAKIIEAPFSITDYVKSSIDRADYLNKSENILAKYRLLNFSGLIRMSMANHELVSPIITELQSSSFFNRPSPNHIFLFSIEDKTLITDMEIWQRRSISEHFDYDSAQLEINSYYEKNKLERILSLGMRSDKQFKL